MTKAGAMAGRVVSVVRGSTLWQRTAKSRREADLCRFCRRRGRATVERGGAATDQSWGWPKDRYEPPNAEPEL